MSDRGILSSLRYLFADFIGEDDDTPPFLPEGLPEPVMAVASDAIHLLIDYQGTGYAQLYVDRLRRFVGKNGVDDAMLTEIARLMAARMSYEDLIRIAQLKLAGLPIAPARSRGRSTSGNSGSMNWSACSPPLSPSMCSMRSNGPAGRTGISSFASARRVGSAFSV